MNTTPYWIEPGQIQKFEKLERNLTADVVVIGAGVTGITAAYLLKRAGASVALLERHRCAARDTGHTTAHLTYVTDQRLTRLVADFGRDHAQAVWDAGLAALAQIETIVQAEQIDCEFMRVPAYLYAPVNGNHVADQISTLKKETSLAAELGFDAAFVNLVPLMNRPGIRFPNQAKFHPRKYLKALLRAIAGGGSRVFEHTTVQEIQDNPLRVVTNGGSIRCRFVVIATNVPLQGKTNMAAALLLQTKLVPYTSYAIGARIPCGLAPEACFWDTSDPYDFLRIDRGEKHDYAIFGGEDHKTGQVRATDECYSRLEEKLHTLIPAARVDHRWSGQIIETTDGLPFIGETSPQQFVATGYCGNGFTFGTIAALMAWDQFAGRSNPWRELFSPARKQLKAGAWNYLTENKDYLFYLLKDRLTRAEGQSLRSVPKGQGKILRMNGQKVAAYRQPDGKVSLRSAVCPHLGCLVHWNAAEKTWDCPCHGSRFKATGEMLAGPAEDDLAEIK